MSAVTLHVTEEGLPHLSQEWLKLMRSEVVDILFAECGVEDCRLALELCEAAANVSDSPSHAKCQTGTYRAAQFVNECVEQDELVLRLWRVCDAAEP